MISIERLPSEDCVLLWLLVPDHESQLLSAYELCRYPERVRLYVVTKY